MPVPPGPISPESEAILKARYSQALTELDTIQQHIDATTRELDIWRLKKSVTKELIKKIKEDLPL
jgi:hypothetical protein